MKASCVTLLFILSLTSYSGHAKQLDLTSKNINYHGHVSLTKEFAWTGTGFTLYLSGGFLSVTINKPPENSASLSIIVQDVEKTLILKDGTHSYLIAENLTSKNNHITLFKRNEASGGKIQLLGLEINDDEQSLPIKEVKRKLLAIGDSITCGYGNEAITPKEGNTLTNQNGYQTYAAIAARSLHAEVAIACWSGRGISRNRMLENDQQGRLPELYNYILPKEQLGEPAHSNTPPNWILINLGTNDLANEKIKGNLSKQHYKGAYRKFVKHLKTRYPNASLIFAIGPMKTQPIALWLTELAAEFDNTSTLTFTEYQNDNEKAGHFHPSVYKHKIMAGQLINHINANSFNNYFKK